MFSILIARFGRSDPLSSAPPRRRCSCNGLHGVPRVRRCAELWYWCDEGSDTADHAERKRKRGRRLGSDRLAVTVVWQRRETVYVCFVLQSASASAKL